MPQWELFTFQGARGVVELRVSLNVRGVFTLNQLAFEELGTPKAVELLFDRNERLVGLKPTSPEVKHSYAVRKQGKNKSYLIGARAFCNYYKIDISKTIRFEDVSIIDGVMVLDLNNTSEVTHRQSKSKSTAQKELSFDKGVRV